jgi:dTDP-4-amino-4,6-dideoxygalactose transaminase
MILCASPLAQYRAHAAEIGAAVARVLEQGSYVLGREVEGFEHAFADYCGTAHAVGVGNGTDALTLALRAMDIGPGDEVITVSHTALATVAGVLASGATPVLVDIDPAYYTIDPAKVEAAITRKTRAVVAVHLYGQAADLPALQKICRRHKLKLIEDCAQSTGGFLDEQRLGAIGDAGTFSFYPTKNLGAIGDGGMVTTNNATLADRIRRLRQYGWNDKRETREVGSNTRLDPLQAAILGAKLPHLDAGNRRRAVIAEQYFAALAGLPLALPKARPRSRHAYHLYAMAAPGRDKLIAHLAEHGVQAGIHYPVPAHRHKGYAKQVRVPKAGLPVTMGLVKKILSLPMYPELADGDVDRVIAAVRSYYDGRAGRSS